jgi:hypothetical protein
MPSIQFTVTMFMFFEGPWSSDELPPQPTNAVPNTPSTRHAARKERKKEDVLLIVKIVD